MCDPSTAVLAALSIAAAGTSYVGAEQAANAQDDANARAQSSILTKRNFDLEAITAQGSEDRRAAAVDKERVASQVRKDKASALVAAGEGGLQVSSNSVEALVRDFNRQQSQFNAQTNENVYRSDIQRDRERKAAGLNAQVGINNLVPAARPSLLGTAIEAGQGVFGALKVKRPDPDLGSGFTGVNPFANSSRGSVA